MSVWLDQMGFKQFVKSFTKHKIDGVALLQMESDALFELGIDVCACVCLA